MKIPRQVAILYFVDMVDEPILQMHMKVSPIQPLERMLGGY